MAMAALDKNGGGGLYALRRNARRIGRKSGDVGELHEFEVIHRNWSVFLRRS